MESSESDEKWPMVHRADVATVCDQVCKSILELELAFQDGELSTKLETGRFDRILGAGLVETYRLLSDEAPDQKLSLRIDAVRALLAQFHNDLVPTVIARAVPKEFSEIDTSTNFTKDPPTSRLFKRADVSFIDSESASLRLDQMLSMRFWRIGYKFETTDVADAYAQFTVNNCVRRLTSDLRGVQTVMKRLRTKTLVRDLKIVPYPEERRFEHLMLDILNEESLRARIAPLIEDFHEKTDLRVKYPQVARRNGARVQVTSIIAPELHSAKLESIRLAEEFVFLSPLSLAEFVQENPFCVSASGSQSFSLQSLWDCLEAKPMDVPQLASILKINLFKALEEVPSSPEGPMAKVPLPIRQLIRCFVEKRAAATTDRLRKREKNRRSRRMKKRVDLGLH